jgi:hypothetical protein
MVEAIMLVAWRVWFAHNEATHAKPLPHVDGSMRFLVSYLNLFRQTRQLSTEEILKGKQTASPVNVHPTKSNAQKVKPLTWEKPPRGWVKLNCDGSFREKDDTAAAGMLLRDE